MSTRKVNFAAGEYYHLYNRGTDKRKIFLDESDKNRFMKLLFVANGENPFVFRDFPIGLPYVDFDRGEELVSVGAYCLMPNHFHILIRSKNDAGVTKFMNKVLTSYTMYFNKKYERSGRLFEGTFKSKYVDSDEYLRYLFAYIHLNPVKIIEPKWKALQIHEFEEKRIKDFLNKYIHSSYLDYEGDARREGRILSKKDFPDYFDTKQDFADFISLFLKFNNETIQNTEYIG